jgi:hypothetical protein
VRPAPPDAGDRPSDEAGIDEDEARRIAAEHARVVDGINVPDTMRVGVRETPTSFVVEWVPDDPYHGGFEYIVHVDKQTGKVLSSAANPLAPAPRFDDE